MADFRYPYGVIRRVDGQEVTSPWMTTAEAAAYLGWQSAESLHEHRRADRVEPDGKRGNTFMWRPETLDRLMEELDQGCGDDQGSTSSHPASGDTPDAGDDDEYERMDEDEGDRSVHQGRPVSRPDQRKRPRRKPPPETENAAGGRDTERRRDRPRGPESQGPEPRPGDGTEDWTGEDYDRWLGEATPESES